MNMAYRYRSTIVVTDRRAQNGAKKTADHSAVSMIDGIADDRAGTGADQGTSKLIGGRRGGSEDGQTGQQNYADD
jgi:hypothetical protein